MTADCYSYPILAILIMSGISLRVSTHLSFHVDPTAISYLQVIRPVGTGISSSYTRIYHLFDAHTLVCTLLIPHYIQRYVPAGRTSLPNLELRDSTRRKSFGIATRCLSERSCLRTTRDPSMHPRVTSLLQSRHCFMEIPLT